MKGDLHRILRKFIPLGLIMLAGYFFCYFYETDKCAKINLNKKVGIAAIQKVELFDKYAHHRIVFDLYSDEKLLISTYVERDDIDFDKLEQLDKKSILVVYDSNNINNNSLLLCKDDFYKFSVEIPDSLQWLKKTFW